MELFFYSFKLIERVNIGGTDSSVDNVYLKRCAKENLVQFILEISLAKIKGRFINDD